MTDSDFSVCPFIKNELCFLTYYDFCHNAKILKAFYQAMEEDAKIFYKWYVYANIHMEESYKNLIWEYLNNDDPQLYADLLYALTRYKAK